MEEKDNSWHERGELPPVGTVCEVFNHEFGSNAAWEKCTILFMGKFKCVYSSDSCHERVGNVDLTGVIEFRPIRTEREKFIEAALAVNPWMSGKKMTNALGYLYDAGFRAPDSK